MNRDERVKAIADRYREKGRVEGRLEAFRELNVMIRYSLKFGGGAGWESLDELAEWLELAVEGLTGDPAGV